MLGSFESVKGCVEFPLRALATHLLLPKVIARPQSQNIMVRRSVKNASGVARGGK
jgi:hypothetical protein